VESVLLGTTLLEGDAAYYEDGNTAHAFWSTYVRAGPRTLPNTPATLSHPSSAEAPPFNHPARNIEGLFGA
jgi:hypothetical protein